MNLQITYFNYVNDDYVLFYVIIYNYYSCEMLFICLKIFAIFLQIKFCICLKSKLIGEFLTMSRDAYKSNDYNKSAP